jgi:replicative DNA helicase
VPVAANAGRYATIVRANALLRRLIRAGEQIARLGYERPSPVEELVDQAEQIVYELAGSETKGDFSIIQDLLHQAFERIAEMAASEGDGVTGLATGFRALDQLLSGFQPSNLVVLAARPSMGKTSLALNIAEHVAVQLRRPVALFSLEMSKAEIAQRLMCSVAGVDQSKLRNGRLANEDWSKVTGAVDTLADAPLFIDDTGSLNVMEIRAKTRRLAQRQGGLGLIVIDYIQLMSAATTTENRVQEVSQISRALKVLGRELNVPVLALSQLSRAVEQRQNKRPMLSDLRESGCLSGDARVFLADSGGYARIADLVGRTVEVLALDPATWRFERRTAQKVFATGERRVYRMRTQLGRTISATANHRFLTIDGWRRLDELEVGSRIVVPCGLPASGAESMPEHELAASAVSLAGARAGVLAVEPVRTRTASLTGVTAYWDRVVAIDEGAVEPVYDMTVPGLHNFVADDIVVHNSIEQDSDVVAFIYRDSYYRRGDDGDAPPMSPDDPDFNKTELIVAKHRNGPTGEVVLRFQSKYTRFRDDYRQTRSA